MKYEHLNAKPIALDNAGERIPESEYMEMSHEEYERLFSSPARIPTYRHTFEEINKQIEINLRFYEEKLKEMYEKCVNDMKKCADDNK